MKTFRLPRRIKEDRDTEGLVEFLRRTQVRKKGMGKVKTIDFSTPGLGRDAALTPAKGTDGTTLLGHIWVPEKDTPEVGDFIILRNKKETTRYKVVSIESVPKGASFHDPPDMWYVMLRFAPRTSPLGP